MHGRPEVSGSRMPEAVEDAPRVKGMGMGTWNQAGGLRQEEERTLKTITPLQSEFSPIKDTWPFLLFF